MVFQGYTIQLRISLGTISQAEIEPLNDHDLNHLSLFLNQIKLSLSDASKKTSCTYKQCASHTYSLNTLSSGS